MHKQKIKSQRYTFDCWIISLLWWFSSNLSFLFLPFFSSVSTTSSHSAQRQSPTMCTATGPIHWWRVTSSAYTSTFSPTAPMSRWCGWTHRTTHWPSLSSSLFSSHWLWSPSWSGAARGVIFWLRWRGEWKKMKRKRNGCVIFHSSDIDLQSLETFNSSTGIFSTEFYCF